MGAWLNRGGTAMKYYLVNLDGKIVGEINTNANDLIECNLHSASVLEFEGLFYLYDHLLQEGGSAFFREIGKPLGLFENEVIKA